jgi:tricorn protease-like protein
VIYNKGELKKYDTKTKYALSAATYTAWHPNGELIAFSVNKILVNFTSNASKMVEVWDNASDLMIFNTNTNTITTSPKVSSGSRENLPCWSPDGKWLYFISAPKINKDTTNLFFDKYSLLRIPFDSQTMTWGDVDTVLSSKTTGKSITFPVVSPDGRYVLFCMINHGYFSIFDKNSDLYLLDLSTRDYKRLDIINSPSTDSYHAWSKNSRWLVFSSKRMDDLCSRPYFTYFDNKGNFHKPFVLPQKDLDFYQEDTWNYNLPVLVDGKVAINPNKFRDFISVSPEKSVFAGEPDALTGATIIQL